MVYKELIMNFIQDDDGSIRVKVKDDENKSFSEYEIYMAYRVLYQLLNDINFDWSIEPKINSVVQRRENNG